MKKILYILATLVISATHSSCEKNPHEAGRYESESETVIVHVMSEWGKYYDGESGMEIVSMMIREDGEKLWNPAPEGGIEGFEYVPHFEYVLKVEKTRLSEIQEGGPDIRYRLIEVISEEFQLGDGYTMTDSYIYYAASDSDPEEYFTIISRHDEKYIIVRTDDKNKTIASLEENGFTIMEDSEKNIGNFYYMPGIYDCIQMTVKGTGNIEKVYGLLYDAPLYNDDSGFKYSTFGRGNTVSISFPYDWDVEKCRLHIRHIKKIAKSLGAHVEQEIVTTYGSHITIGVTNISKGNAIEICNWFTQRTEYKRTSLGFPEWGAYPD